MKHYTFHGSIPCRCLQVKFSTWVTANLLFKYISAFCSKSEKVVGLQTERKNKKKNKTNKLMWEIQTKHLSLSHLFTKPRPLFSPHYYFSSPIYMSALPYINSIFSWAQLILKMLPSLHQAIFMLTRAGKSFCRTSHQLSLGFLQVSYKIVKSELVRSFIAIK